MTTKEQRRASVHKIAPPTTREEARQRVEARYRPLVAECEREGITPYFETWDQSGPRTVYTAWGMDGDRLADSTHIAGPKSNAGKFLNRKGRYMVLATVSMDTPTNGDRPGLEWFIERMTDYMMEWAN